MLVDENYADVLSFLGEPVECGIDLAAFGLVIAYQEVALRVWRVGDVADTGEEDACD